MNVEESLALSESLLGDLAKLAHVELSPADVEVHQGLRFPQELRKHAFKCLLVTLWVREGARITQHVVGHVERLKFVQVFDDLEEHGKAFARQLVVGNIKAVQNWDLFDHMRQAHEAFCGKIKLAESQLVQKVDVSDLFLDGSRDVLDLLCVDH